MRSRHILLCCLIPLCLAVPFQAAAAEPYLVRDLHRGLEDEAPSAYGGVTWNGVFYYGSSDLAHGVELWRSDGTPEGTWRVADLCSGLCGSNPLPLTVFGGHLYFMADDGVSGTELWRTDGTEGGEQRVRDLCPGPCGSELLSRPVEMGGALFFLAADGTTESLWKTDGTRRGTVRLASVCASGFRCIAGLGLLPGRLLFGVWNPLIGEAELWSSDGTSAGTAKLPGVPGPIPFFVEGGFSAATGGRLTYWTQDALWSTDGTSAGTEKLARFDEIVPAPDFGGNYPVYVAAWNGAAWWSFSNGHLIRTDGTREGTALVWDFGNWPPKLVPLPDALLVVTDSYPRDELWRTRGTPETTEKVAELSPTGRVDIGNPVPLGDRHAAFIAGGWDNSPARIWITDGTAAGTHPLGGEAPFANSELLPAGDRIFYVSGSSTLEGLWRTDGTPEGTFEVRSFQGGPGSGGPLTQTAIGGTLVFSARTSATEVPLFRSDGTSTGTWKLSENAVWASSFTRAGNRTFFTASEKGVSTPPGEPPFFRILDLWQTDGTRPGTRVVRQDLDSFRSPSALGNLLFFAAGISTGPFGDVDVELWKSDGTKTSPVRNIDPFRARSMHHSCTGESSLPGPGVAVGGRLLFAAHDGLNGRELWSSDGTRQGTRRVLDINPASLPGPPEEECEDDTPRDRVGIGSDPQGLLAFRRGALFTAHDGTTGRELWWSDGTAAGTRRVADLRPGAAGSAPHDLTVFRDAVWFFASAAGVGEGLWRTDGTAAGTVLVHPLTFRGQPSWGRSLTVAGDRLFFSVFNDLTGAELWTSRGTGATTGLVLDLRRGSGSSAPQSLTAAGNLLIFAADDGEHGLEAWQSDGTAAGTIPLGDIHPGRDASSPGPFTPLPNGLVLTGADDGVHGRELWAIEIEKP